MFPYIYKNGDFITTLLADGTKIRYGEGTAKFPESCDVKITNLCSTKCIFCHENSIPKGLHGDIDFAKEILSSLPSGSEIAIGGGDPLEHPELEKFVSWLSKKEIIPNITINTYNYNTDLVSYLIDLGIIGIGVSIPADMNIPSKIRPLNDNFIYHLILGIHSPKIIDSLKFLFGSQIKILILGLKSYGRGSRFKQTFDLDIDVLMKQWNNTILDIIKDTNIAFDNLALEQLDLKNKLPQDIWNKNYMGNDGQFSMYIDLVKKEYARSSTSERISIPENSKIEDLFSSLQESNNNHEG